MNKPACGLLKFNFIVIKIICLIKNSETFTNNLKTNLLYTKFNFCCQLSSRATEKQQQNTE